MSKEEGDIDIENAPVVRDIGKTVIINRPEVYITSEWARPMRESNLSKDFFKELSTETWEVDANMYFEWISENLDEIKDDDYLKEDIITLERKGAGIPILNEVIMNLAIKKLGKDVETIYKEAGQFKLRKNDMLKLEIDESNIENRDLTQTDSCIYLGQWNKTTNLKEGKGVAIFNDGSLYEGLWKEGERSWIGRMIYSDASVYLGEWYKDIPNGYGVLISNEIGSIKGYWLDGKIHGQGYEIMTNGNTYRGNYINGRKEGKGVFVWKEGNMYMGEFKDNKMEGQGVYLYDITEKPKSELNFETFNGKKYKGAFKNNLMNGKGLFLWPDGRSYDGEYLNDKKHGMGEFKWADSKRYVGEWKDGYL